MVTVKKVTVKKVSITRAKYGWSKYGGARHGLVRHVGKWFCQACGQEQPDSLPAFMLCVDNGQFRDFVRLCAVCENIVSKTGVRDFSKLKKMVEKEPFWKKYEGVFNKK